MDLATRYLGLTLKNPIVASASPLTIDLDNIRRIEDAGGAAVVLPCYSKSRSSKRQESRSVYDSRPWRRGRSLLLPPVDFQLSHRPG